MVIFSHLVLGLRLPRGREWRKLAIYGLLANTLYLSLYVLAMQQLSAGLGALSVAMAPIFINLGAAMLDKRRPGRVTLLSLLVCLAGVAVAAWPLLRNAMATPAGLAILLVAVIIYAASVIYFARTDWNDLSLLTINAWQIMFGTLFIIPLVAVTYRPLANHWVAGTWASVLWLAVIVSIFAVRLWLWLVKVDAARSSYWLFLCPVFGFLISNVFTHEPLTGYTVGGMAMVIAGIWWEHQKAE